MHFGTSLLLCNCCARLTFDQFASRCFIRDQLLLPFWRCCYCVKSPRLTPIGIILLKYLCCHTWGFVSCVTPMYNAFTKLMNLFLYQAPKYLCRYTHMSLPRHANLCHPFFCGITSARQVNCKGKPRSRTQETPLLSYLVRISKFISCGVIFSCWY